MHQTLKSAPQKTDHRPINGDNCFEEDTDDEHRISPLDLSALVNIWNICPCLWIFILHSIML